MKVTYCVKSSCSSIASEMHLALETKRTKKWNLYMHGSKAKDLNTCLA